MFSYLHANICQRVKSFTDKLLDASRRHQIKMLLRSNQCWKIPIEHIRLNILMIVANVFGMLREVCSEKDAEKLSYSLSSEYRFVIQFSYFHSNQRTLVIPLNFEVFLRSPGCFDQGLSNIAPFSLQVSFPRLPNYITQVLVTKRKGDCARATVSSWIEKVSTERNKKSNNQTISRPHRVTSPSRTAMSVSKFSFSA